MVFITPLFFIFLLCVPGARVVCHGVGPQESEVSSHGDTDRRLAVGLFVHKKCVCERSCELSSIEGRNNMGYLRVWLRTGYPDHIESDRDILQIMGAQVKERGTDDLPLLAAGHRLDRVAETVILSGFYLDEDISVAIFANDIKFSNFLPIVSCFDAHPLGFKIGGRKVFSSFTEADPFPGQTL